MYKMEKIFLETNNEVLSELLEGFEPGKITMLFGNAATGKTTSCFQAAISVAETGGKVIFIDAEKSFNPERIEQICGHGSKEILENIFLIQPKDFTDQFFTIQKLKKMSKNIKIKLIIVDTIGNHYRNEFKKDTEKYNERLLHNMQTLYSIARDYGKVVVLTNQVYADITSENSNKMIGGRIVENLCKTIIELKKEDEIRTARLIKKDTNLSDNKIIEYVIKKEGLKKKDKFTLV